MIMHSIRRTCQSALRNSHGFGGQCNVSRRAFSRSVARSKASIDDYSGGLPVFLEPSSPELSSLLATINSQVLLPEHLTKDQKRLVYKQKYQAKLETEPVEVTIGDVTLPLVPLDRNTLPNRLNSLRDVTNKAQTTADWENVVRVLEGFHSAGIAVKPEWQEMVVRKLIEKGHHNIVLKALQRVKATGLRLSNYHVTYTVLKGAHDRAAESDWDAEETAKALRYSRLVAELMEEEEHLAQPTKLPLSEGQSRSDWRSRPFVVAVPTELAAVAAQKHSGNVDVVKTLASRLVYALKQDVDTALDSVAASSTKSEADFKTKTIQRNAFHAHCSRLLELLVVSNALRTSQAVLGAEMPLAAEAAEHQGRIRKVMDEGLQALPKLQNRGGQVFQSPYPAYLKEQLEKVQA
ncbi:hypothetical protein E8E13_006123 [Curvularia kusanoi]|uniref:Uncharacterized protein n=1 Tax=Curvularia kusanoi TaxID=90978 RepID=A0A9P4TM93_CURKU|nr:hypothetical protein E8E13_006123 [Curvularia kusanoi]